MVVVKKDNGFVVYFSFKGKVYSFFSETKEEALKKTFKFTNSLMLKNFKNTLSLN